ncbi:hypothetical protein [uncultured Pontibacter sp.]|uniref:hypothetical protein n=1 Tax=uncultured Pontibacter sp. TaxID=453356 RepID=UPI0026186B65|nr:hypothetical protein [uncultured Pontibacter sp.]
MLYWLYLLFLHQFLQTLCVESGVAVYAVAKPHNAVYGNRKFLIVYVLALGYP